MFTCVGVWCCSPARSAGVEHAQRKALHPVAEEVASGQQIAGAEQVQVLVYLDDQVVAIVDEGRGEGLAARAGGRQSAPRIAVEQALNHGIDSAPGCSAAISASVGTVPSCGSPPFSRCPS